MIETFLSPKTILSILIKAPIAFSIFVPTLAGADYRNFYGISWRGTPTDNLRFAKQMGYDYVFYDIGMENEPQAAGFRFYMNGGPEYWTYDRGVDINKSYTSVEQSLIESYSCWKSRDPFPNNLATGWWFSDTVFSQMIDFQQQAVIDNTIEEIVRLAKSFENPSIGFTFGGLAWDEPELYGAWYRGGEPPGDSCVLHPGINHQYSTYSDGHAAFYKQLFRRIRQEFPDAKFLIEPYFIYGSWISQVENRTDRNELMVDIMCQEAEGTEFVDDNSNFASGLITKNKVCSTTPNIFGEYENRLVAAKAAINGAWFSWFGRFGGTGDMPNYQNIYEVPARLQLIRVLPNWDNLANVSLSSRSWNGSVYQSPNSYADANIIYSRHPDTRKIFAVFLNNGGVIRLRSGETVSDIQCTNSTFIESGSCSSNLSISGADIRLSGSGRANSGYIITTSDSGGGGPVCGQNGCEGGETCSTCPQDCGDCPSGIQGDLNDDGNVDIFDYNLLVENFGNTSCGNIADIDGNCKVDIFDYNILVENFGKKA